MFWLYWKREQRERGRKDIGIKGPRSGATPVSMVLWLCFIISPDCSWRDKYNRNPTAATTPRKGSCPLRMSKMWQEGLLQWENCFQQQGMASKVSLLFFFCVCPYFIHTLSPCPGVSSVPTARRAYTVLFFSFSFFFPLCLIQTTRGTVQRTRRMAILQAMPRVSLRCQGVQVDEQCGVGWRQCWSEKLCVLGVFVKDQIDWWRDLESNTSEEM